MNQHQNKMYKTAECVSPKHPDKMADQISDAILDFCLTQDPNARVAIETLGGHGEVVVMGELTFKGKLELRDIKEIVARVTGKDLSVTMNIVQQSPEIANGVDTGGAGDQGIMIGYACNENEAMIPQEQLLSRELCQFIYKKYSYDGKTQITIDENNKIQTVVASFQNVSKFDLKERVGEWLGDKEDTIIHCNPAGDWTQGGFEADTGVTGRKLAIDNYGTRIAIGGGAFSGKDPSKVDRSGAYMARYIAVDLLKKYNCKNVKVSLAYAIGIAEPVMATAIIIEKDGECEELNIINLYDCTPKGIIELLDLKKPQYETLAQWGHMGRDTMWK